MFVQKIHHGILELILPQFIRTVPATLDEAQRRVGDAPGSLAHPLLCKPDFVG